MSVFASHPTLHIRRIHLTDYNRCVFGFTQERQGSSFATANGVRFVHRHDVETFSGTDFPPVFATAALIGESDTTAHCYSDRGKLAFGVFTCGS